MERESRFPRAWLSLLPLLFIAVLVTILSSAVRSRSAAVHVTGGTVGEASYVYYRSERGLQLMIWYDAGEVSLATATGRTPRPVYWLSGRGSVNGQPLFDWEIETADGRSARFRIDGTVYDLSQGTVFVVSSQGREDRVHQLRRDLSGTQPDVESVARFAAADPELADWTQGIAYREARR